MKKLKTTKPKVCIFKKLKKCEPKKCKDLGRAYCGVK
jgi:hypothetical protein